MADSAHARVRCDCFTHDPGLPAAGRYMTADYTGVGGDTPHHGYPIDRGHLLRSFDRESGLRDNANTFCFSNIIPQASAGLVHECYTCAPSSLSD